MSHQYKAIIRNWAVARDVVWGEFDGHPNIFDGEFTHTARIVEINELSNGDYEVQTINNWYLLKDKVQL